MVMVYFVLRPTTKPNPARPKSLHGCAAACQEDSGYLLIFTSHLMRLDALMTLDP